MYFSFKNELNNVIHFPHLILFYFLLSCHFLSKLSSNQTFLAVFYQTVKINIYIIYISNTKKLLPIQCEGVVSIVDWQCFNIKCQKKLLFLPSLIRFENKFIFRPSILCTAKFQNFFNFLFISFYILSLSYFFPHFFYSNNVSWEIIK